jgi:hypothetical protein
MYIGPDIEMELCYARILYTIYVTFMYSSGMPLLYFIAFLTFALSYWVDKYMFLRFYRIPPRHTGKLSIEALQIMKYAIVFHFLIGLYMFSYRPIMESRKVSIFFLSRIHSSGEYLNADRFD